MIHVDKVKVAHGTTLLSDLSLELYPSALEFYGDEYKKIIDETLHRTYLYEWTNQSFLDIMCQITRRAIKPSEVQKQLDKEKTTFGFHYLAKRLFVGMEHFVVVRNLSNKDEMRAILAHELYGHAVCATQNSFVTNDYYKCFRNGISFERIKTNELINDQANEGMIEYIAGQIMHIYNPKYAREKNLYIYDHAVELAKLMFKYIGKEKMLELLVQGNAVIEKIFDKNNVYSWRSIASELEKNQKEIDIDDHLDGFVKRYKYENR